MITFTQPLRNADSDALVNWGNSTSYAGAYKYAMKSYDINVIYSLNVSAYYEQYDDGFAYTGTYVYIRCYDMTMDDT